MLKRLQIVLAATVLVAPLCAAADCSYPKAPQQIPDGKTASEPEMMQAMSVFKQYNGDVNAYTSCLEKETAERVREVGNSTGAIGAVMQIKSLQTKKHNAAVDELQDRTKRFNEQIRAFKARGA